MSKFVDEEYAKSLNKDDAIYDLQSVSYYQGDVKQGESQGHYYATGRLWNNNGKDTWGNFNDQYASVLDDTDSVQNKYAKILFYARRK